MFKPEYIALVDSMGDDLRVCSAARVSFAKESEWEQEKWEDGWGKDHYGPKKLSDKDTKLIGYLAKHGHISPFFHPMITLRIKMPIFVARQWFKSQIGFARNETSRRYVSDAPEFWIPTEWRKASADKKQGSSDETVDEPCFYPDEFFPQGEWRGTIMNAEKLAAICAGYYESLIAAGIAPEQARMILPQSMLTEFVETASLAAYARLVKLRTTPDAQLEIRLYANRISEIMGELFPVSWKALMEN